MGMELVKFDEDDVDRKRVIKENVGKEVLLKDEHERVLVGKIDLPADFHYLFLEKGKTKPIDLGYHDLRELYVIN